MVQNLPPDISTLRNGMAAPIVAIVQLKDVTDYTFKADDDYIQFTASDPITVTIPPNIDVAFPVGWSFTVEQGGAGAITLAAGSDVTINSSLGLATTAQYGTLTVQQVDPDVWTVKAGTGSGGGSSSSFIVVGCEMDAATTSGLTYGYKAGIVHFSNGAAQGVSPDIITLPDDTAALVIYCDESGVIAASDSPSGNFFYLAFVNTESGNISSYASVGPIAPAQTFQPVLGSGVSQDLDPVNFNGCVLTTDGLKHDNVVNLPLLGGFDALNLNGKVYTISPVYTNGADTIFVASDLNDILMFDSAGFQIGYCAGGARFGVNAITGGVGISFRACLNHPGSDILWQYIGNQQPSNLTPSVGYVPVDGTPGQVLVNNGTPGGAWGTNLKASPGEDFIITAGDGTQSAVLTGGDDTGTGAGDGVTAGGSSFTDGIKGGNAQLIGGSAVIGDADGGDVVVTTGGGHGTGRNGRISINRATSAPGASAGTLLNAPSAGDPAIWLEIVIDNVTYYFPGWTA